MTGVDAVRSRDAVVTTCPDPDTGVAATEIAPVTPPWGSSVTVYVPPEVPGGHVEVARGVDDADPGEASIGCEHGGDDTRHGHVRERQAVTDAGLALERQGRVLAGRRERQGLWRPVGRQGPWRSPGT